jgi:hypothetical protein
MLDETLEGCLRIQILLRAFQGLIHGDPTQNSSQEDEAQQGSPGWTKAPGVQAMKRSCQTANPLHSRERWTTRGSRCNCQHHQAHSTRLGGVASVYVVTWHSWAVHHACPTSNQYHQVEGAQGQLQEACWDQEGVHKYIGGGPVKPQNLRGWDRRRLRSSKVVKAATYAHDKAKEALSSVMNQVLLLYSNLVLEEMRQPWNKIMAEHIHCSPWTDLREVEHSAPQSKTWDSFMECIIFHLLAVFRNDAAETQRYYISNGLKKPNQVPIRQFIQHMQQLNAFLNLLPCLNH